MRVLRRRAYAKSEGFKYKTNRSGTWTLINGHIGAGKPVRVTDEKFLGIAKILIKHKREV